MMRSIYFYFVIFGSFGGVFARYAFAILWQGLAALAIASAAVALFLFLHSRLKAKPLAHFLVALAVFFFAFSLGGLRMGTKLASLEQSDLALYEGQAVSIAGIALDDVGVSDAKALLAVRAVDVGSGAEKIRKEKVLLSFAKTEMRYGDVVVAEGRLEKPENFITDQGKEFDYISFLEKDGVKYTINNPKILHQEDGGVSFFSLLHSIKRSFISNVESVVPEPESALSLGVTIAGKGALPKDVKEDFIKAGVIHIVVLSGYNIAIVIGAMIALFGFLGRRWASLIAISAVALFVVLSGGTAPVVRAAIMAGIVLIGALSYTPVIQNRALFGAAFFMCLWNPLLLTSDASFALSFLATFAIINLAKPFEARLSFASPRFGVRKILAETLSTQIFVLPYLLYQIGRLSLIAPISNIFILPAIPVIMFLCFIVGVTAFIPFIALPLAWALTLISSLVIYFAHLFASLPFASWNLNISLPLMLAIYLLYFAIGFYLRNKKPQVVNPA